MRDSSRPRAFSRKLGKNFKLVEFCVVLYFREIFSAMFESRMFTRVSTLVFKVSVENVLVVCKVSVWKMYLCVTCVCVLSVFCGLIDVRCLRSLQLCGVGDLKFDCSPAEGRGVRCIRLTGGRWELFEGARARRGCTGTVVTFARTVDYSCSINVIRLYSKACFITGWTAVDYWYWV